MEVILNKDVEKIGKAGSAVKVKDGFARNFLFPHKLAVPATSQNIKIIQQGKEIAKQKQQKNKEEAEKLSVRLSGLSLTIPVLVQKDDKLYGGISAVEISKALKDEGFDLAESLIVLDDHIRSLGIYEVAVKLHPEVETKIKIWVVKK